METNIFERARSHFDNGIKFYNNSEYELAESEFIKSLKLVPDRLSTISNLIKIYIKNEEKIKLEDLLKKFNNLKNEKEILFGLAYKEYFNSKYKDSIDICNLLLNFKEIELEVLDLLASNHKKTKNFLFALKIYKIILQKNRNHFANYSSI